MECPALVVCPLRIEASALRRALRGVGPVHCCGPGARAVQAWIERQGDVPALIVLAGLAGALRSDLAAGSAHLVTAVVGPEGERASAAAAEGTPRCTITSTPRVVCDPSAKSVLARSSGADLVDLESLAFARAATARGWLWAIVRGVSDDAATALPHGTASWTDDRGSLRIARVAIDLAKHPRDLATLLALARDGRRAMRAVAELIRLLSASSSALSTAGAPQKDSEACRSRPPATTRKQTDPPPFRSTPNPDPLPPPSGSG